MGAVRKGLGLLLGIVSIFVLFILGLHFLGTPSQPYWFNLIIGIIMLIIDLIIGLVMVSVLRSSMRKL